jgi:hypothetical protein
MSQQAAIIVLVDVGPALAARTLENNVYLFDNLKNQGSEGLGTGNLVTAIRGSCWNDGSQASEQVLNWAPYALGSIPSTVPRNYLLHRSHQSDQQALAEVRSLASQSSGTLKDVKQKLGTIADGIGTRARVRSAGEARTRHSHKVLDVKGNIKPPDGAGDGASDHNNGTPVITDISGEAVEQGIMYPAQYGSPDLVSGGMYWSASLDTSRPGTYAYTMEIELHELVRHGDDLVWEPVRMRHEVGLKITYDARRNGFTGAGVGLLPVVTAGWPTGATTEVPEETIVAESVGGGA